MNARARVRSWSPEPLTAAADPKMTVAHLNRVQKAATARAWELEEKLIRILQVILVDAAAQAASGFRQAVTDHLTASAVVPLVIRTPPNLEEWKRLQDALAEAEAITASNKMQDTFDEIRAVAEKHRPEGGYGDVYWHTWDRTVFWVCADWSTNEEIDAAEKDFLAIDGVEGFDYDAEADPTPWLRIYTPGQSITAAAVGDLPLWSAPAPNEIIDAEALVASLRTKTDPVRQAVVETTMTAALNGVGIAFDVTNPLTANVLAQTGSQIVNIADTTQLNVMRIIRESYQQGLSIPDTAEAIQVGMVEAAPARATMIARCLPAETPIDSAVVRAVTRRWYEGHMAVVITESGREFTATPNHPMLTSRGWSATGEIHEGDYLVCRGREKYARTSRNEDVGDPPPTIAEVFEAAAAIGITERRTGGQPDFHGDGREGEVEIARPDRELAVGNFAALYQHRGEQIFAPSVMVDGASFCSSCGHLLSVDEGTCLCGSAAFDATFSQDSFYKASRDSERLSDALTGFSAAVSSDDVSGINVIAARGGSTAMLEVERARGVQRTSLNASRAKPVENSALIHAYLASDVGSTSTVEIESDRVVSCRLVNFRGHVYNLVTPYGYFTVNGGYTGNTELSAAVNGGSLAAVQIVDAATGGGFSKVWLTAPGATTPRHELYDGLDGQTVALDAYFDVGGAQMQFPGDPAGPPDEVVNCRCAVSYVEGGEEVSQAGAEEEGGDIPGLNADASLVEREFGIVAEGDEELALLTLAALARKRTRAARGVEQDEPGDSGSSPLGPTDR